ncbi:MAG: winged helix-turn-helix transcriptional regulator, partial [Ruminococcus sp.]|nr:winged helix-turn-helix transcriptional regulator [Candidatus Apopatosoma intestinale]
MEKNKIMIAKEREYFDLADFYKIFSDSSRIKILFILLSGPHCVKHLSEKAEMSQSAVSHQLAVLRHTNIVRQSRSGQTVT